MFKVLFAKQKKLPWKPKKDRGAKPCLSRFPRELRVRCFARDARPYSTERSAPIPDSNPASRTGRVLSHLSICIALYAIRAIKAISISPSPQVRAYFRSFMGRNRFKKSSARAPNASAGEEDVRQGLRGLFQFCSSLFQKSWNKIFPCLPAILRDSLNLVPTPFFELEQDFSVFTCGYAHLFQLFWFSTSLIYTHTYIDPFLYSFLSRFRLKIIGTNGTFTRNAW